MTRMHTLPISCYKLNWIATCKTSYSSFVGVGEEVVDREVIGGGEDQRDGLRH